MRGRRAGFSWRAMPLISNDISTNASHRWLVRAEGSYRLSLLYDKKEYENERGRALKQATDERNSWAVPRRSKEQHEKFNTQNSRRHHM